MKLICIGEIPVEGAKDDPHFQLMVDTETGVQYIFRQFHGTLFPRLNSSGTPVISSSAEIALLKAQVNQSKTRYI